MAATAGAGAVLVVMDDADQGIPCHGAALDGRLRQTLGCRQSLVVLTQRIIDRGQLLQRLRIVGLVVKNLLVGFDGLLTEITPGQAEGPA